MSLAAAFETDDGTPSWVDWISAVNTFNYCCEDPLLDWLAEYGVSKGFVPDDQQPWFDAPSDRLRGRARRITIAGCVATLKSSKRPT